MAKRIFGQKRDDWRKLRSEELPVLYYSLNIIRMLKSRKVRWSRHVARMRENRNAFSFLMVKARRKQTTRKT
jgi:hypothetical protein